MNTTFTKQFFGLVAIERQMKYFSALFTALCPLCLGNTQLAKLPHVSRGRQLKDSLIQ